MENFERRSLQICLSDDHRAIAHTTSNLAFTIKGKDGVSRIMQYAIPTIIDVTQSLGRMSRKPGKSGLVKSTGRKDIIGSPVNKAKRTIATRDKPFRFTEVLFTSAPDGEKFYMLITHQKDKCVNYFCTKYIPLDRPCFGIHINNMIVGIPRREYRFQHGDDIIIRDSWHDAWRQRRSQRRVVQRTHCKPSADDASIIGILLDELKRMLDLCDEAMLSRIILES